MRDRAVSYTNRTQCLPVWFVLSQSVTTTTHQTGDNMKLMHAAPACFCVGLPPPSGVMAMEMQAPWEASPAPFILHGEQVTIDEDRHVADRVILADHSALDVA